MFSFFFVHSTNKYTETCFLSISMSHTRIIYLYLYLYNCMQFDFSLFLCVVFFNSLLLFVVVVCVCGLFVCVFMCICESRLKNINNDSLRVTHAIYINNIIFNIHFNHRTIPIHITLVLRHCQFFFYLICSLNLSTD